jgi:hypothetical protein
VGNETAAVNPVLVLAQDDAVLGDQDGRIGLPRWLGSATARCERTSAVCALLICATFGCFRTGQSPILEFPITFGCCWVLAELC